MKTQYNFDHKAVKGEEFSEPSMTVPGEARTIQDILTDHANGKVISDPGPGQFFDEEDLSKVSKFFAPHKLDFTDVDELQRDIDEMSMAITDAVEKKKQADKDELKAQRKVEREFFEKHSPVESEKEED